MNRDINAIEQVEKLLGLSLDWVSGYYVDYTSGSGKEKRLHYTAERPGFEFSILQNTIGDFDWKISQTINERGIYNLVKAGKIVCHSMTPQPTYELARKNIESVIRERGY